jgi:hypothetical protein
VIHYSSPHTLPQIVVSSDHFSFPTFSLSPVSIMGNENKNEVVMLEQQMTRDEGILKPVPIVAKTDYSGAYEKTDPREIALVKKLDRWIMPMLWSMYWLNYLGTSLIHKTARAASH